MGIDGFRKLTKFTENFWFRVLKFLYFIFY